MGRKIFLVLFALPFISQVSSNPFTKEITADQSPQLKFRDIITQIERTDIPAEIIRSLFINFEEFYSNLADLLQSEGIPDVSDVLDVFNGGFGARLLVVDGKNIEVDYDAVGRLLLEKMRPVVKSVFPDNLSQQSIVYAGLEQQMQRAVEEVRPQLINRMLPMERLTSAFTGESTIATRATDSTDILTQLVALVQTTVCSSIVSPLYSSINDTLASATTLLESITVSSDDDAIVSIIANLISLGVELGKEAIDYVKELVDSLVSSTCSDLVSSRKRRDLSVFEDLVVRSRRDTALTRTGPQAISVRNFNVIFALLVSLLAAVVVFILVYLVTGGISSIISLITSFIFSSITNVASSLISSVLSVPSSLLSWLF